MRLVAEDPRPKTRAPARRGGPRPPARCDGGPRPPAMGHASIQMTFDLYGKLFKDEEGDRAAMERVQAALPSG